MGWIESLRFMVLRGLSEPFPWHWAVRLKWFVVVGGYLESPIPETDLTASPVVWRMRKVYCWCLMTAHGAEPETLSPELLHMGIIASLSCRPAEVSIWKLHFPPWFVVRLFSTILHFMVMHATFILW